MTSAYSELLQITHRFYYYLDEQRYKDLVALMRPDGVWHRQGKVLKGHAQVMAAMQERPSTQIIRHLITNAFLEQESENEAKMVAYLTAYKYDDGSPKKPPVTIDGPFRLLLVKKRFVREGGRWLIAESSGTPEFDFRASR
jgi:hypothetical protein